MKYLQNILLGGAILFSPLVLSGQEQKEEFREKITADSLNYFINENQETFLNEFNRKFNTNLDYSGASVCDIYEDNPNEIGRFNVGYNSVELSDNISKYYFYEIGLKPEVFLKYSRLNATAKGVFMHELGHAHTYMIINELKNEIPITIPIRGLTLEETIARRIYNNNPLRKMIHEFDISNYLSKEIIEEGISEYCAASMKEIILDYEMAKPKSMDELYDKNNFEKLKYQWGPFFVKPVLDRYGLKHGTKILILNPLPTDRELLMPELYYKRLKTDFFPDKYLPYVGEIKKEF